MEEIGLIYKIVKYFSIIQMETQLKNLSLINLWIQEQ